MDDGGYYGRRFQRAETEKRNDDREKELNKQSVDVEKKIAEFENMRKIAALEDRVADFQKLSKELEFYYNLRDVIVQEQGKFVVKEMQLYSGVKEMIDLYNQKAAITAIEIHKQLLDALALVDKKISDHQMEMIKAYYNMKLLAASVANGINKAYQLIEISKIKQDADIDKAKQGLGYTLKEVKRIQKEMEGSETIQALEYYQNALARLASADETYNILLKKKGKDEALDQARATLDELARECTNAKKDLIMLLNPPK